MEVTSGDNSISNHVHAISQNWSTEPITKQRTRNQTQPKETYSLTKKQANNKTDNLCTEKQLLANNGNTQNTLAYTLMI